MRPLGSSGACSPGSPPLVAELRGQHLCGCQATHIDRDRDGFCGLTSDASTRATGPPVVDLPYHPRLSRNPASWHCTHPAPFSGTCR